MTRLPIRLRVTAAFAVAMAAVLAGSGIFLYVRLDAHLSLALDRELRLRAQDLSALVSDPSASLARDGAGHLVERGESYAQLLTTRGRVIDATPPLASIPLVKPRQIAAAARAPVYVDRRAVPGLDEPSRLLVTRARRNGASVVLVVGTTLGDRAETLAGFRDELLLAGPVALVLASLAGYALAGLSLRPVETMRRRAGAISAETAGERLPVPPTGDELERLAETLNAMLERLEGAVARERDFVADAGHELRTPLSLLKMELELALRHAATVPELREAVRGASQEADRLAQLAEDLLVLARSGRDALPLRQGPVDADELLRAVARRVEWRLDRDAKRLRIRGEADVDLTGDRLRLEQALSNVVDNALRHGGDEVELEAVAVDGRVELHVRDDGGGFPPAFLDRAFDRFTRADGARSRGGAGLGLAIVQTIAAAHGGSAHAANGPNGGADVWIALPRI